jgi:hypothetical protein
MTAACSNRPDFEKMPQNEPDCGPERHRLPRHLQAVKNNLNCRWQGPETANKALETWTLK